MEVHYRLTLSLVLFMSMGFDYVSELRPSTGLLFILQVIYEQAYREKRRNYTDRQKPNTNTLILL
jgi:hypothetical protein